MDQVNPISHRKSNHNRWEHDRDHVKRITQPNQKSLCNNDRTEGDGKKNDCVPCISEEEDTDQAEKSGDQWKEEKHVMPRCLIEFSIDHCNSSDVNRINAGEANHRFTDSGHEILAICLLGVDVVARSVVGGFKVVWSTGVESVICGPKVVCIARR